MPVGTPTSTCPTPTRWRPSSATEVSPSARRSPTPTTVCAASRSPTATATSCSSAGPASDLCVPVRGGPAGELEGVAVEGAALDQVQVEVGRVPQHRVDAGLAGDHGESGQLDPFAEAGGHERPVQREAAG